MTTAEGLAAAPWELALGLDVSPGQELSAPRLHPGGQRLTTTSWKKALLPPRLPGGSGFPGRPWCGEGAETLLFLPLPARPPGPSMSGWVGSRQVGQQEPCLGLRGGALLLEGRWAGGVTSLGLSSLSIESGPSS